MSNSEISRNLSLYAELLQLHGEDARLSDWLSGAAYRIRQLEEELVTLPEAQRAALFRPEVQVLISDIIRRGFLGGLEELIQLTPPGLFEMMRIRGLGGRKLHVLWKSAKIADADALLDAAKSGRIRRLPGFGIKTEQNIIAGIEALHSNARLFHYASIASRAVSLEQQLQQLFETAYIRLCGDVRRQASTVHSIELISAVPAEAFTRNRLKRLMTVGAQDDLSSKGHSLDEIPVTIRHCPQAFFYRELFERTGSTGHVAKVIAGGGLSGTEPGSEELIYDAAGLPFIPPELREDCAEWEWAKAPQPLLSDKDILGVVHNHTNWSDGVDELEPFVEACRRKGYQYVVISDHSQNAHYAGGLKPDKVLRQVRVIDEFNQSRNGIRVFKGIECDILISGELDYDPQLLKVFDLVIISVHQQLKMVEKKATDRLIRAIENPFTTILGHMTGRQLLVRAGYPLDFRKVIDACAANGVVIELNANPYRLDMDWSHIPYAIEKGVAISINPDSHSIHEIDNIHWGVVAARKGGLTKEMTWNARPLGEIEEWIARRRQNFP